MLVFVSNYTANLPSCFARKLCAGWQNVFATFACVPNCFFFLILTDGNENQYKVNRVQAGLVGLMYLMFACVRDGD